jgi:hypothetical protein
LVAFGVYTDHHGEVVGDNISVFRAACGRDEVTDRIFWKSRVPSSSVFTDIIIYKLTHCHWIVWKDAHPTLFLQTQEPDDITKS